MTSVVTGAVAPVVIETVRRRPVLGVRFRDDATGEVVRDVRVRLSMAGLAEPAEPVVTPSGVFAWRSLPGLIAGALDSDATPVLPRSAEVTVSDPEGRYLAYRFSVTLPLAGLAVPMCGSPPEPLGSPPGSPVEGGSSDDAALPLFSLPGRPPPTAMAVVRAALLRGDGSTPAAYATLRLEAHTGESARGVADARGQVVVFLAYPKVDRSRGSVPVGSAPFGPRQPLTEMTWELDVRAGLPRRPVDAVPDLCDLIDQDDAQLTTVGGTVPARPVTTASLTYGRELVLPPDGPRRELLVGP